MAISHRMAGGRLIARSPAPRWGPERLRLSKGMREDLALQPPRAQPQKKAAQQKGRRAQQQRRDGLLAERSAIAEGEHAAQGQKQDNAARYRKEPTKPTTGRRPPASAKSRRGGRVAHGRRSAPPPPR